MEKILKEVKNAVDAAGRVVDYYENEIEKLKKFKSEATDRYILLKKQYTELLQKLNIDDTI